MSTEALERTTDARNRARDNVAHDQAIEHAAVIIMGEDDPHTAARRVFGVFMSYLDSLER